MISFQNRKQNNIGRFLLRRPALSLGHSSYSSSRGDAYIDKPGASEVSARIFASHNIPNQLACCSWQRRNNRKDISTTDAW
jgi:hypothetical protein